MYMCVEVAIPCHAGVVGESILQGGKPPSFANYHESLHLV